MSREKETIHLTPTKRGWASKGGKGLGFMKNPPFKPKVNTKKQQPQADPPKKKDPNQPVDEKKKVLSWEAWLIDNKRNYNSEKEARAGYDKYVAGTKGKKEPEKPLKKDEKAEKAG